MKSGLHDANPMPDAATSVDAYFANQQSRDERKLDGFLTSIKRGDSVVCFAPCERSRRLTARSVSHAIRCGSCVNSWCESAVWCEATSRIRFASCKHGIIIIGKLNRMEC